MTLANPMLPAPVTVIDAREECEDVTTLTLEAAGARPVIPGQFNMLYAFGVGEAAISTSGDPARSDVFVHTIKAVGATTRALCRLRPGDVLGVRGPFGEGWPMDRIAGADLLIIAGGLGLAPLRPVLYDVARSGWKGVERLTLLAGARRPEDLLFQSELEDWRSQRGPTVVTTVDHASKAWTGRVGVVPALLRDIELRPTTIALVCGPEVMMRYVVRELARRGLPEDRLYLSMERNMKCAIGFCGHCQLGPAFVCKDGPVLRFDRLRRFFWPREL